MAAKYTEISNWLLEDIDPILIAQDTSEEYITFDFYSAYYVPYGNYGNYSNYSNTVTVTVHPTNQTINLGSSVSFSCSFSGVAPTYQWYVANNSTETGTAISGATSATYSFTPSINDDGKYFYCVLTAGNVVNTSRALLTVNSIKTYDVGVSLDWDTNILKFLTPTTATISSYTIDNTEVATVASDGTITGISVGSTTCVVNASNGLSQTININVYKDKIDAVFFNIATAIRSYTGINNKITPNNMTNTLNGVSGSNTYTNLEEIFINLADSIRTIKSITNTMLPEDMHKYILGIF